MKIVVLDGYTLNPGDLSWDALKALGEVTVYDRTLEEEEVICRIADAQVVLTNKTKLTKRVLEQAKKVEYIGVLAAGYDVVDIAQAKAQHITVTNIPGYGSETVAQAAISLLLEICNRVGRHSDAVKQGRWASNPDWCFWDYPILELAQKTMGIIGFGRIGQHTGKIARALGMNVLISDVYQSQEGREMGEYVSLDELFSRSDVIVLHCPLMESTRHLINRKTIEKMKDGVILINNSRGPLIDEQALAEALQSKKVYGAGLDVLEVEPALESNPLLQIDNCIITPHNSWAAVESRRRLMNMAVDNLRNYLAKTPTNEV